MKIKIPTHEVLAILLKHRDEHEMRLKAARLSWQQKILQVVKIDMEELTACTPEDLYKLKDSNFFLNLPELPKSHLDDYDRMIEMCKTYKEDTIELNEYDYVQIVQDKWPWTKHFNRVMESYT